MKNEVLDMKCKRHLLLLLGPILLSACSLAPEGGRIEAAATTIVDAGMSDRMSFNDKKAEVLLRLPCDISLGAYYRLANSTQQEALVMLCSGRRVGQPTPPLNLGATDSSNHAM